MGGFDSAMGFFSPIMVILGVLAAILIAGLGWGLAVLWHRPKKADAALARAEAKADALARMLVAGPDGLFIWALQGKEGKDDAPTTCSARLAVLLDLKQGRNATFSDVLDAFTDEGRAQMETAAQSLRRDGRPFDLILKTPVRGHDHVIQITGARVATGDGNTDLLWMRDVSAVADLKSETGFGARNGTGSDAKGAMIRVLLDALPFPVWLRTDDLEPALANRATDEAALDNTHAMAARALEQDRAVTERHLLTKPGSPESGDGTYLVEVTETPLPGGGTIGYAIDHSSADDMEAEFVRHLSAHEETLENLTAAIAIYDDDAHLQFFNSAFAALWQLDPDWLDTEPGYGQVLERLRFERRLPEHADFRRWREDQIAQFDTLEGPIETMMHRPDGITVRAITTPYPLGGLMFVYEDVTNRLALERSYNTLIAVQRETLDNLLEGLAVFGADGRLKLHNPAFARLWNIEEERLRNEPHVSDVAGMMVALLGDGNDQPDAEALASRLMRREAGSERINQTNGTWIEGKHIPLPDGGMVLSYLDVSAATRAEQDLLERAQMLHDVNHLKSEFISNVSYEISTPLNSVMGFADILKGTYFGDLNVRQDEYVDGILEASRALTRVVGDIIDFASLEAGTLALELDSVDVLDALSSTLGLVRETARRKNLKIEFECAPDIGWIIADKKRFKQIALNLLSNALNIAATPGRVRLKAERDGDTMVLTVTSDRGAKGATKPHTPSNQTGQLGMLEEMETLPTGGLQDDETETASFFGPGSGPDGGGLGLSLVRRFVEMHGGSVSVKQKGQRRDQVIVCRLPAGHTKKNATLIA